MQGDIPGMARIFGLGETVFDIIFKNQKPVASQAGGTVLNALVSLARAGHEVYLISEIGIDHVGENITRFLEQNNVNTRWLHRFTGGKTPVALAFLDDANNAVYQVYKDFPEIRFHVKGPDFRPGDILLYGSFFAVNPELRPQVIPLLQKAREQGAYLIYDPNFRRNHAAGIKVYRPIIEENFSLAHLVRGSDEDFKTIYEGFSIDEVLSRINGFGADAIITAGSGGAHCLVSGARGFHVAANDIVPVSTIGAGDNFNAGLAHGLPLLYHNGTDMESWKRIVQGAISFSTDVCMSLDNYISQEFANSLK